MNRRPLLRAMISLLIFSLVVSVVAAEDSGFPGQFPVDYQVSGESDTSFNYQGSLSDGDKPTNGLYDLKFDLFDAQTGGASKGTSLHEDVAVIDGKFHVALDFGESILTASSGWLEIGVRPADSTDSYTILASRQPIGPLLYSVGLIPSFRGGCGTDGISGSSDNGCGVHGTSVTGIGVVGGSIDGKGVYGSSEKGAGVSGTSIDGPGVAGESRSSSGIVGVTLAKDRAGVWGVGVERAGVEGVSNLGYGVWGKSGRGAGVFGESDYSDGLVGSSLLGYGVKGESLGNPGVFGTSRNADGVSGWTDKSQFSGVAGKSTYGRGVSGTSRFAEGVYGESGFSYGVYGRATERAGGAGVYGVHANGVGVKGESSSGVGGYFSADYGMDVVLGGRIGDIRSTAQENSEMQLLSNYHVTVVLDVDERGYTDSQFKILTRDKEVLFAVDKTGKATTQVLQITGGSDLSELFTIRSGEIEVAPIPGMAVSIDPSQSGDLMVTTQAYDRQVAGIISGAGDVTPGVVMGQQGSIADGEFPVALAGRVYAWADATDVPIRPGDLLTTSDTPGHVMAVQNFAQAQGAIIGKAMSQLESGMGLVLVLVSLQ